MPPLAAYGHALSGLRVQAPFGAVGIGTGTGAVLSGIPEGACACGAEGHMASIGPPALGAKGCVERLRPTGETTHYDLCVAGAPANHVRCASLRSGGRRLAVRTAMEHPIGTLPRTPFPASRDFPSRGNEKIGGTGYCVTYDTDSQSRNADFISIARRAIRHLQRRRRCRPLSEANTTRHRQAATTLGAKPRQPSPLNPLNLLNPLNPGHRVAPFPIAFSLS